MKYLVLGAGRQGVAVLAALKTLDPSCETTILDVRSEQVDAAEADHGVVGSYREIPTDDWDCVVSTLPYQYNLVAATHCALQRWKWVDLGGNFQSSQKIQAVFRGQKVTHYTDCGLAPGLLGILGWYLIPEEVPLSVQLYCGGLAVTRPDNRFGFAVYFNVDGLMNEYWNCCQVLQDNLVVDVPPLTVDRTTLWDGTMLEAFVTSGGVDLSFYSEMRAYGVTDASYRTLRYLGHAREVRALFDKGLTREEVGRIIEKLSAPWLKTEDRIVIEIRYLHEDHRVSYQYEIDTREGLTAMQRATAGPAAVVAELLAEGHFGILSTVSSQDVANKRFFDRLGKLDLWKKQDLIHL